MKIQVVELFMIKYHFYSNYEKKNMLQIMPITGLHFLGAWMLLSVGAWMLLSAPENL